MQSKRLPAYFHSLHKAAKATSCLLHASKSPSSGYVDCLGPQQAFHHHFVPWSKWLQGWWIFGSWFRLGTLACSWNHIGRLQPRLHNASSLGTVLKEAQNDMSQVRSQVVWWVWLIGEQLAEVAEFPNGSSLTISCPCYVLHRLQHVRQRQHHRIFP